MVVLAPHGASGTYGQLSGIEADTLYAHHVTVLHDRLPFHRETEVVLDLYMYTLRPYIIT
jgi:hypothetical protein